MWSILVHSGNKPEWGCPKVIDDFGTSFLHSVKQIESLIFFN
ncbi:hypothetical protein J2X61_003687 [Bacillus sp. 3255]|nr:hypothetical protein [Bacillus sp. 3255]